MFLFWLHLDYRYLNCSNMYCMLYTHHKTAMIGKPPEASKCNSLCGSFIHVLTSLSS